VRTVRIAIVGALALGAVTVMAAPAAHATAPAPPYTLVTIDGSGNDPVFGADYVADSAHGALSVAPGTASGAIDFSGSIVEPGDSPRSLELYVGSADGATALTAGSYPIVDTGAAGDARLTIFLDGGYCYAAGGTLNVSDIQVDGVSGTVTAFAGDYSGVTCDAGSSTLPTTLSGVVRYQSTQGYDDVAVTPRSWDWGNQVVNVDAQPRAITFTNYGVDPQTFGPATIAAVPPSTTNYFHISADDCNARTLQPGDSCWVTVVAHPVHAASGSNPGDSAALDVPVTGHADRVVRLAVQGETTASTFLRPGPQRIQVLWQQLPRPLNSVVDHYQIFRGTSPGSLTFWRNVPYCCTTDRTVKAGTAYYYAIQPMFAGGGAGMRTPVIAAEAWPKYSAGMYHRFPPFRILSGHSIGSAHAYTLKLLGQRSIPSSGVSAVVLDVIAAKPTQSTSVTVYPRGSSRPAAADVAVAKGATRSNLVIARVGRYGDVEIANAHGSASITVDVSGYFSAKGLSSTKGQGGALNEYLRGGTIMDTKGYNIGAVPHDYYVDAPVNFDPSDTPHVTSLLVQVTAYGSKAGGTITAFPTNGHVPNTAVLAYSAGITTTSAAIVSAGAWSDPSTFLQYPSVSFLNRGPKPVQLKVSILGFFDDNTYLFGQRYAPTAPKRLFADTIYAGGTRTVSPGSYGDRWTTAFNVKVRAGNPTRTTALSMWPRCCGVTGAAQAQVRAPANRTTISSTLVATGDANRFCVHNSTGHAAVSVWSFGRFDAYPAPNWPQYVGAPTAQAALAPAALPADRSVVEDRLDDTARPAGGAPVVVDHLAGIGAGPVTQYARHRYQFRAE
jgi:hypothetical protein